MQSIRNAILWHVRARRPTQTLVTANGHTTMLKLLSNVNQMCTTTATDTDDDRTMDRVIVLVKKFDKVDASKVSTDHV